MSMMDSGYPDWNAFQASNAISIHSILRLTLSKSKLNFCLDWLHCIVICTPSCLRLTLLINRTLANTTADSGYYGHCALISTYLYISLKMLYISLVFSLFVLQCCIAHVLESAVKNLTLDLAWLIMRQANIYKPNTIYSQRNIQ